MIDPYLRFIKFVSAGAFLNYVIEWHHRNHQKVFESEKEIDEFRIIMWISFSLKENPRNGMVNYLATILKLKASKR